MKIANVLDAGLFGPWRSSHPRLVLYPLVIYELSMGLRPTHMDENRLEPKRYHQTARNGEGRADSGSVEAVYEFGLGSVIWTNLCSAIHSQGSGLVARDGV